MYVFTFSDGKEWTTGSPAVSTVFNQSGTMYVNVTATNLGKPIRIIVAILFGTSTSSCNPFYYDIWFKILLYCTFTGIYKKKKKKCKKSF